jgi:hypothetical protein
LVIRTRQVLAAVLAIALGAAIGLGIRNLVDRGKNDKGQRATAGNVKTTTLRAGSYSSKHFPLVRSFRVSAGWRLDIDTAAILEISHSGSPRGSVGFDRPSEVFDDRFLPVAEAMSNRAKVRPIPENFGDYLRSLPEVDVSPSIPVKVNGIAAESFFAQLKPLQADNTHVCNGASRCMFYARRDTQLFALFENDVTEFTVVPVGKQTMVIAAAAPGAMFGEFRTVAQQVVQSVRLRPR